jgi:hypothetical protein
MTQTQMLMAAVSALVIVIGVLWKQNLSLTKQLDKYTDLFVDLSRRLENGNKSLLLEIAQIFKGIQGNLTQK